MPTSASGISLKFCFTENNWHDKILLLLGKPDDSTKRKSKRNQKSQKHKPQFDMCPHIMSHCVCFACTEVAHTCA